MIIFNRVQELQSHLDIVRKEQKSIGFVPTMGALHQGHIALVSKSRQENDLTLCSIFVNPTQFNELSDLEKYPRTLENDIKMLEKAGCDILFAPEISDIYSEKELELKRSKIEDHSWKDGKRVDFGQLDQVMEGAQRPGHFNGVAQVVSKLFRIVQPDKAYFGQKDFQQLAIIRSMTQQLGLPVKIISCPIVREADGLAMSSRNTRLDPAQREAAPLIAQILFKLREMASTTPVNELKDFVRQQISKEPLMKLEYIEIADPSTLLPVKGVSRKGDVACIAVRVGAVRLIDNIIL